MRKYFPALLLAALLAPAPAVAQIKWNVTYADAAGVGFNDTTVAGSTTVGQLRQASVTAATNYLSTVLDGRGTVTLNFNASQNAGFSGSNPLASFGTSATIQAGSFSAGQVFQRATTNTAPFSAPDGSGSVDFGYPWHYAVPGTNTTLNSGTIDFVSVVAHEFTHALGFTSTSAKATNTGQGSQNLGLGTADTYRTFDKYLQKGNVTGSGALFNTDVTQSNYASYKGTNVSATDVAPYTGGNSSTNATNFVNNTTNGLYFGGKFATEVFGGAVPIYSPTTFAQGSSGSHVNVGPLASGNTYGGGAIGLMNYQSQFNTVARQQAYEIAMLMDIGWNVYDWNGTTAKWKDGVVTNAGVDTYTLANSKWTSQAINVGDSAAGFARYNTNASQGEAPVLPVYGQTTANIVLNFGGAAYTTTNDIGDVRVSRLYFTNTGAVTLQNDAATNAAGKLIFGLNSDGTPSVLVPKIVQNGSGTVNIGIHIQTNTIATQTVLGSTFTGHNGVTIEGTGSGAVTLSGNITGTGGITKNGSFGLTLSGTGNTYSGGTTINAGILTVAAGSNLGTGAVTINNTGTLARSGTGSISTGNVSIANGGTLTANLAASGTASQLNLGSSTLNFATTGSKLSLVGLAGFVHTSAASYTLALLSSGSNLQLNGVGQADGFVFGTFIQGIGTGTSAVLLDVSNLGTTLTTGDTFSLARSGNSLVLTFSPVPEPATVLAASVAGLGAFGWFRRKRRAADPAAAA